MLIVGIILIFISLVGVHVGWRANEWREPLLVLTGIIERSENPKVAEFYLQSKRRGAAFMIFLLGLYSLGAALIYLRHQIIWLLVIELLVFLWIAKGVISLIRASYSKKIRLLNYLYSPYLLAWRRDHLSEYSDEQVAAAICEASGIDINQLSGPHAKLDSFLIELCKYTRPKHESEQYPDALKKLHQEAAGMVWNR